MKGLSYAALANVPAVNGLYSIIFPSIGYSLLGSSMQQGLGPVAIVSLLTGQIVNTYVTSPSTSPQDAIDTASQAALCAGIFLAALGILKLGNFIQYISHPVMSGFTSGAAMVIGLNQLKSAFGFSVTVPQTGLVGYAYNYHVMTWFVNNWNGVWTAEQVAASNLSSIYVGQLYRNVYATQVC